MMVTFGYSIEIALFGLDFWILVFMLTMGASNNRLSIEMLFSKSLKA